MCTYNDIFDAICNFHEILYTQHTPLKTLNPSSSVSTLSSTLSKCIPVPDLSKLASLGTLKLNEFEQTLISIQSEAKDLLLAFTEPIDSLGIHPSSIGISVKGTPLLAGSSPIRLRAADLWSRPHVVVAHRVCPAVDKLFYQSGANSYHLYINEVFARLLECVLRNKH